MTALLEEPVSEKKVVATLIGRFGGHGLQFVPLPGGQRAQFDFKPGIGHVREYTDIAKFHYEEAAIRALPNLRFPIVTRLGEITTSDSVKGLVGDLIGDGKMHRHIKYQLLAELLAMIEPAMRKLESQWVVGRKPDDQNLADAQQGEPPKTERERAIITRRMALRRMGENEVRKIVQNVWRLQIPVLNNYEGMMDAVIGQEFPEQVEEWRQGQQLKITEHFELPSSGNIPDYSIIPIAQLRELAKAQGIQEQSRSKIIEALLS